MASLLPPKDLARVKLNLAGIQFASFTRLFRAKHPDPLGFGKARSRFADPRPLSPTERFGVLYLGQSPEVSFVEAVLRDDAVGTVGPFPLAWSELESWNLAEISSTERLNLVDLRGAGMMRLRMPSDALRGSDHGPGMQWSLALYQHPELPDGILYHSRLNEMVCVAIYDRAVAKLHCNKILRVVDYSRLHEILAKYRIELMV